MSHAKKHYIKYNKHPIISMDLDKTTPQLLVIQYL